MLVLATDTSGKHGSVALVRCEDNATSTLELVPIQGGTFSAQLIPQIAEILSKHNLNKSDLDAFAVATGPGSFTGLRVGLAAVKALAEVLKKPIAAVTVLELIASEASGTGTENRTIWAVLDAGRKQVFVGEYKIGSGVLSHIAEYMLSFEELAQLVKACSSSPPPLYTPDENVIRSFDSGENPGEPKIVVVPRPDAHAVARLGWKKIRAGLSLLPEELDASYIRRADAESRNPTHTPK
jgi:tRNA threonylcarbamoyladenosine biosynthesis protein TsaB